MYNNNINQGQINQPSSPMKKEEPGMAIASMVLGIISIVVACCIATLSFILSLIGFILGVISLTCKKGGTGMAIAGVITSSIAIIISILCFMYTGITLLGSMI